MDGSVGALIVRLRVSGLKFVPNGDPKETLHFTTFIHFLPFAAQFSTRAYLIMPVLLPIFPLSILQYPHASLDLLSCCDAAMGMACTLAGDRHAD